MRPPLLLLDDVKPWIGAELPALRTILWPLGIHALTPTKGDGYRLVKQRTLHLGDLVRGHRLMMQYTESLAVTLLGTEVLKRTTHVERPDHANDQSFPSGHASRAFSAATYVHRRYGLEPALPLYVLGTYVGYTRVQARRHRWADVAGSAAVSAAASWWLVQPRSDQRLVVLPEIGPHYVGVESAASW